MPDGREEGIDIAGSMVAWSTDDGINGQQVFLADAARRTIRKLTSHYAPKPTVAVDPSGRVCWIDQVFPTSAVFVSAP